MAIPSSPSDGLAQLLQRAVQQRIKEIVEEEVKRATVAVETRVREDVGMITSRVFQRFTMQQYGTELVIKVDFNNSQSNVREERKT